MSRCRRRPCVTDGASTRARAAATRAMVKTPSGEGGSMGEEAELETEEGWEVMLHTDGGVRRVRRTLQETSHVHHGG